MEPGTLDRGTGSVAKDEDGAGRERGSNDTALIVDGHLLFADLLRFCLQGQAMGVLPVASTGAQALETVEHVAPRLVVLEMHLPDASGLAVGRRILERRPDAKVLALSEAGDPETVLEAIASGFHGYLVKAMLVPRLVSAIQAVLDGQVVMSQELAQAASGARSPEDLHIELLAGQLTVREREVLTMLGDGLSGREIARNLYVSHHTVRSHCQNILAKLQVHSRLEAVAFATRYGILRPPGRGDDDTDQNGHAPLGAAKAGNGQGFSRAG